MARSANALAFATRISQKRVLCLNRIDLLRSVEPVAHSLTLVLSSPCVTLAPSPVHCVDALLLVVSRFAHFSTSLFAGGDVEFGSSAQACQVSRLLALHLH